MDLSKQPGISFKGILLARENFKREPEYTLNANTTIDFSYCYYMNKENNDYYAELTATVKSFNEHKEILSLSCTFVGIFAEIEDEKNMEIEEYMKIAAPALMIPFVREHISSITLKAGIKPILINPINVIALLKTEDNQESKE
ncbi:MAG: protein-export chaperone SecB [Bacillota bacterium]